VHSILYWLNPKDPLGPKPKNPYNNAQFASWESSVLQWATKNGIARESNSVIPRETDNVHLPQFAPKIRISGLEENKIYASDERIVLTIQSDGVNKLSKAEVFLNGAYLGTASGVPLRFAFTPDVKDGSVKTNTVRVVGFDTVFNRGEKTVLINIANDNS
jgi:hypothetical protein